MNKNYVKVVVSCLVMGQMLASGSGSAGTAATGAAAAGLASVRDPRAVAIGAVLVMGGAVVGIAGKKIYDNSRWGNAARREKKLQAKVAKTEQYLKTVTADWEHELTGHAEGLKDPAKFFETGMQRFAPNALSVTIDKERATMYALYNEALNGLDDQLKELSKEILSIVAMPKSHEALHALVAQYNTVRDMRTKIKSAFGASYASLAQNGAELLRKKREAEMNFNANATAQKMAADLVVQWKKDADATTSSLTTTIKTFAEQGKAIVEAGNKTVEKSESTCTSVITKLEEQDKNLRITLAQDKADIQKTVTTAKDEVVAVVNRNDPRKLTLVVASESPKVA